MKDNSGTLFRDSLRTCGLLRVDILTKYKWYITSAQKLGADARDEYRNRQFVGVQAAERK